jgi:hypothetical protein
MSIRSLSNNGTSVARLVAGTLAVLLTLGVSLMGIPSQCYGSASPQQSHTDVASDASPSKTSTVVKAVHSARETAPTGSRCGPVSVLFWSANSATVRPVRPLDDVIRPEGTSVPQDVTVEQILPNTHWASAASAHPPQGHSSDSPPAQESMGTLRSVVLRL